MIKWPSFENEYGLDTVTDLTTVPWYGRHLFVLKDISSSSSRNLNCLPALILQLCEEVRPYLLAVISIEAVVADDHMDA